MNNENPAINYIHDMEKRVVEAAFDNEQFKSFITLGGKCSQDGNAFIALIGEDLQSGCVGVGDTRGEAILNCIHNFCNEKAFVFKKENEK